MDDVQRDLGRLEAQLEAHAERHERIERKIDELGEKVDRLSGYANRTKGAWGLIVTASAIGAALIEGARALLGR